jgi:hypothetical protein
VRRDASAPATPSSAPIYHLPQPSSASCEWKPPIGAGEPRWAEMIVPTIHWCKRQLVDRTKPGIHRVDPESGSTRRLL